MEVSTLVYQKFYEVLRDCFEEMIKPIVVSYKSNTSRDFWLTINPKTGKELFTEFFPGINVAPLHFYTKKYEFNPSKKKYGTIKDDVQINILVNGIGVSIPDEEKKEFKEPRKKAHKLYLLFVEQYCPEYLEEECERLKFGIKKENKENYKALSLPNRTAEEISQLVCNFYACIDDKKLKEAWDLIHPEFQNMFWEEDFNRFSTGYSNTISTRNVHVFDIDEVNLKCKFYYEDTVRLYITPDLAGLEEIPIDRLPEFVEKVRKFQSKIEEVGLENVLKVGVPRLFDTSFSEYIRYTYQIPLEKLQIILPKPEPILVPRLMEAVCGKDGQNMKIKIIKAIKSVSIR